MDWSFLHRLEEEMMEGCSAGSKKNINNLALQQSYYFCIEAMRRKTHIMLQKQCFYVVYRVTRIPWIRESFETAVLLINYLIICQCSSFAIMQTLISKEFNGQKHYSKSLHYNWTKKSPSNLCKLCRGRQTTNYVLNTWKNSTPGITI